LIVNDQQFGLENGRDGNHTMFRRKKLKEATPSNEREKLQA
jgi:hypothetical protein